MVWRQQVQPSSAVTNMLCVFLRVFLSASRFWAGKLLHVLFLFLVALGSELLRSLALSDCRWLLAVPAKATCSAMESLADPAKAACPGSSKGKSKWTPKFILDPASPEAGSWVQEQEQPWGIGCKACSFCKCVLRLAKFEVCTPGGLQSVNFHKHQRSKVHQNGVKMFLTNGNVVDSGLNSGSIDLINLG